MRAAYHHSTKRENSECLDIVERKLVSVPKGPGGNQTLRPTEAMYQFLSESHEEDMGSRVAVPQRFTVCLGHWVTSAGLSGDRVLCIFI